MDAIWEEYFIYHSRPSSRMDIQGVIYYSRDRLTSPHAKLSPFRNQMYMNISLETSLIRTSTTWSCLARLLAYHQDIHSCFKKEILTGLLFSPLLVDYLLLLRQVRENWTRKKTNNCQTDRYSRSECKSRKLLFVAYVKKYQPRKGNLQIKNT